MFLRGIISGISVPPITNHQSPITNHQEPCAVRIGEICNFGEIDKMTPFRILVVDDEEDIVASLGGLLRDEGYEVVSADSGEDGLEKAVGVDLMVLDLMLPGIDGLETLRRIKERDASLPVVMMSGHGTVIEAVEAVQAGAYDFLEKPLSGEKVLVTVENALEWRQLEQKNEELEDRVRQHTAELEETSRTVQAQNELLEAQNRRLRVERAVERVRGEAIELFNSDPGLKKPEHELLLKELRRIWKTEGGELS